MSVYNSPEEGGTRVTETTTVHERRGSSMSWLLPLIAALVIGLLALALLGNGLFNRTDNSAQGGSTNPAITNQGGTGGAGTTGAGGTGTTGSTGTGGTGATGSGGTGGTGAGGTGGTSGTSGTGTGAGTSGTGGAGAGGR